MLDAIRYLVDNGVKWAALPADFPPYKRVHAFFTHWRDTGLLGEFHDRMRAAVRTAQGRDPEPTSAVIDSQSVKAAASVHSSTRGYDDAKKINGRKRHLVVDTLGLLLAILVTPADAGDRATAADMLPALKAKYRRLHRIWADSGYTGDLITWAKTKPPGSPGCEGRARSCCAGRRSGCWAPAGPSSRPWSTGRTGSKAAPSPPWPGCSTRPPGRDRFGPLWRQTAATRAVRGSAVASSAGRDR